jgi:hypothetical protein
MNNLIIRPNGINQPTLIDPKPNSIFRGNGPTEESRLGQPNFMMPGVGRIQYPEDANADSVIIDPAVLHQMGIYQVPAVIPVDGDFTIFAADYNMMANYQYVKDAMAVVGAAGRNDQQDYNFVAASNVFTAGGINVGVQAFSSPNLITGFQIEWGLSILSWAPFTMTLQTHNFKGQHYQPVDRRVVMRFESAKSGNGGIFQCLFGQRLTYSDSCGCGGYGVYSGTGAAYSATGGMNKAIVQNAVVPGQYQSTLGGGIFIPPYNVVQGEDLPFITLTVPAALASGFSATCHLLTAGSPYMASAREALFLDGMVEQPGS